MSMEREYYDNDGNYWQTETPHYIPPEEAIKTSTYVHGFISAVQRKKTASLIAFSEEIGRNNKFLLGAYGIVFGILLIVTL